MIGLIIVLIIIGVVLWGVQAIPMDATIKRVVTVLVIACALLWLLSQLTGYGPGFDLGVHRYR